MTRDDIQKLLGGYATGTLTVEERQALFEAALEDQELFDALAREEALRETLADPTARAQLLAAIDEAPAPWYQRWWRPLAVVAACLLAVAGVALWQSLQEPPRRLFEAKLLPPVVQTDTQNAPVLPPPPEFKRATEEAIVPKTLPGGAPSAATPPPPPPARPAFASQAGVQRTVPVNPVPAPMPMLQSQQDQIGAGFAPGQSAGSSLLPRSLHGSVKDAAGAPVREANVTVKSDATGAVTSVKTDERGAFSAPETVGGIYQISASAPGFQTKTVSLVAPPGGQSSDVTVQLDVGAVTETVEVNAAAPMIGGAAGGRGGGGRGTIGGAFARKAEALAAPLIQWQLIGTPRGGKPIEVPADGSVSAGATLKLRITPASDGNLRVTESNGRTIADRRVQREKQVEISLPRFNQPGRVELRVEFQQTTTTIAFNVQ